MRSTAVKWGAGCMAAAVILCALAVIFAEPLAAASDTGITMPYAEKLFDTDTVLTVDIQIDEADFADLLENATDEEYYACDVVIGGETFQNVGIRAKGNTSLANIASDPTTDRYSFKLEFDHYIDGQTCFGLDKLVLNNNYADATNMKEALVYDMFAYLGADASLYNYAKISINGEYWGVYLALEAVEDSFLTRNYGTQDGELYKPDSMEIGGGMGKDGGEWANNAFADLFGGMDPFADNGDDTGNGNTRPDRPDSSPAPSKGASDDASDSSGTMPEQEDNGNGKFPGMGGPMGGGAPGQNANGSADTDTRGGFPQNGDDSATGSFDFDPTRGGGFSMGGNGADLRYTDDDPDSYSAIWEGEVTSTDDKDHARVIEALGKIAAGESLDTYMDTDNLVRYMAAHVFSVNEDSLSGSMAHNYYLYEANGRLNLIPWDYNLAFGGMSGGDASSMVNDPIADPFDATDFFDTLLADTAYNAAYRENLAKLVDYVENGAFDAFYSRVRSQIDTLVETDPTAFYTYDEYVTAAETLYTVVQLRAQSIAGQLAGTIPDTADTQRADESARIDASDIDLSVMGVMNGGKGDGNTPPEMPNQSGDGNTPPEMPNQSGDGGIPPEMSDQSGNGSTLPEMPNQSGDGNTPPEIPDQSVDNGTPPEMPDPSGNNSVSVDVSGQSMVAQNLVWFIGCALICAGGILFVLLYRKHPRHG